MLETRKVTLVSCKGCCIDIFATNECVKDIKNYWCLTASVVCITDKDFTSTRMRIGGGESSFICVGDLVVDKSLAPIVQITREYIKTHNGHIAWCSTSAGAGGGIMEKDDYKSLNLGGGLKMDKKPEQIWIDVCIQESIDKLMQCKFVPQTCDLGTVDGSGIYVLRVFSSDETFYVYDATNDFRHEVIEEMRAWRKLGYDVDLMLTLPMEYHAACDSVVLTDIRSEQCNSGYFDADLGHVSVIMPTF